MKRIKDYTLGELVEMCTYTSCSACDMKKNGVRCRFAHKDYPSQFDLTDRPRFTAQEVEDAKALMRLFEYSGNSKIKRHGINELWVAGGVDDCAITRRLENSAFPSVADGEEYTLGEIIGEEDTNDADN